MKTSTEVPRRGEGWEECNCICHEPGQIIEHVAPCCQYCQFCGMRIRWNGVTAHEAQCPQRNKAHKKDEAI